jgi:hypothetical protein
MSAGETSLFLRKDRLRLVERPPNRWVELALRRFKVPDPRCLKRLAEALCVLILGIAVLCIFVLQRKHRT